MERVLRQVLPQQAHDGPVESTIVHQPEIDQGFVITIIKKNQVPSEGNPDTKLGRRINREE